jgi:hypothetical protein
VGINKDLNVKRPGEKEPGTFHYNPGNMSGKPIGTENAASNQSDEEAANHRLGGQQNRDIHKRR